MSDWNFDTNSSNTGGKAEFTKFGVGVTRIRVLDDAPMVRWTHWLPAHKRSVNCPGKGCPICEIRRQQKANGEPYTYAMGRRYAMNIFNLDTGKVEIMEQGVGFFEDLRDVKEDAESKGHTLRDVTVKVKRRGLGKDDTSYRLDLDEVEPTDEVFEGVIELKEYFKPHTPEQVLRVISGEEWNEVMKSQTEANNSAVVSDEDVEIQ